MDTSELKRRAGIVNEEFADDPYVGFLATNFVNGNVTDVLQRIHGDGAAGIGLFADVALHLKASAGEEEFMRFLNTVAGRGR